MLCRNFFKAQREPWLRRFFAIQLDNSQKDDYVKTASIMETTNPEIISEIVSEDSSKEMEIQDFPKEKQSLFN